MADKIYKGDIGTALNINTGADISAATEHNLKVKKPDGTETTWSTSIYQTYYLRHISDSGTFDQAGVYHLQAYVVIAGQSWRGETVEIEVFDTFE